MSSIPGLSSLSPLARLEGLTPLNRRAGRIGAGRAGAGGRGTGRKVSFQDALFGALENVNRTDSQAQAAVARQFVDPNSSQIDGYVRTMQADLAFRTLLQVRNKLLEAYNEIRQMQM